jgi:hypothetical protein
MSIMVRAAIDAVPSQLALDPELDSDNYAKEIATNFDLATPSTPEPKPATPSQASVNTRGSAGGGGRGPPGVEQRDAAALEVTDVAGHDGEGVHARGGGDHR